MPSFPLSKREGTTAKLMFIVKYIKEVFSGVKSLLVGMRRTGYYFTHHKEIITQQYPDNKETLHLPERFKGEVVLIHDENNEHACTGCTACELACPNATIKIVTQFTDSNYYSWMAPSGHYPKVLLRSLTMDNRVLSVSDTFIISPRMIAINNKVCYDNIRLSWTIIPEANKYIISLLNEQNQWVDISEITSNIFYFGNTYIIPF